LKPDILLAGCGKMGGALLERWKNLGLYNEIQVVEPAGFLKSAKDIPASFKPGIIVFAVKPQTLPDIIGDYSAYKDALCISIAAGKPVAFFEPHFKKVVRAMPNLPASVGKGMTVACANENVSAADRETAAALIEAVGAFLWVDDEKLLNPVTALSGSGPAYVFLLIEMLEKAGVHIGLSPDMAKKLARQTVIGSAALVESSPNTDAAVLRANVTSPGGTTQAALDVLLSSQMQDIFNEALAAATKRAEELAK
jgi:pyrroline-5-carboxylate reductase